MKLSSNFNKDSKSLALRIKYLGSIPSTTISVFTETQIKRANFSNSEYERFSVSSYHAILAQLVSAPSL